MAASNRNLGPSAWLNAACAPLGERPGPPRIERRASDGRLAALVEAACGSAVASHVLVAEPGGNSWQDVAVFEGRAQAMEWQGADLLLAFPEAGAMRVFSLFPGMRLRDASGPGPLRWLRISTRRSRR